ncbi:MAG: DUF6301 family protein [Propionibacteriaceae bacterium]|nr:DUF6301 family protein [Propionibacteriaceae bacterium]
MKSIPVDELLRIVDFWVNQEWPLGRKAAEASCDALGWERDGKGFYVTPYDFKVPEVLLVTSRTSGHVGTVEFRITDVVQEDSPDRVAFMNDVFSAVVARFRATWGKGKVKKEKHEQRALWDLPGGSRVEISNIWSSVTCSILSPDYAEVERYLGG